MVIEQTGEPGKIIVPLHPLFAEAVAFLKTTDLRAHEAGKVVLKEGELMVNFADACPKTKEEALLETHNDFIDIQIPLSGVEVMAIRRVRIARSCLQRRKRYYLL